MLQRFFRQCLGFFAVVFIFAHAMTTASFAQTSPSMLLHQQAGLHTMAGRYDEAILLMRRAVAVADQLDVAMYLSVLGDLLKLTGQIDQAAEAFTRSVDADVNGPNSASAIGSLLGLAQIRFMQKNYLAAEQLYLGLIDTWHAKAADKSQLQSILSGLTQIYITQGNWERAVNYGRQNTDVIVANSRLSAEIMLQSLSRIEASLGTAEQSAEFVAAIKASNQLRQRDTTRQRELTDQSLLWLQWVSTPEAAQALAQMSARNMASKAGIADLVRERQDMTTLWQRHESARKNQLASPETPDTRRWIADTEARMLPLEARLANIDRRMAAEFPAYLDAVRPEPLNVVQIKSLLRPDEALIGMLETKPLGPIADETFMWVVTRDEARWVRTPLSSEALANEVAALRCGLDYAAWRQSKAPTCAERTGKTYTEKDRAARKALPFDTARAYRLYRSLFGELTDVLSNKSLLIVPTGALTQLPLHVLVTRPPSNNDMRTAAWLGREHKIAILPAISSLKFLRAATRRSDATKPMIGFGNPLLNGQQNHSQHGSYYADQARLALSRQNCERRTNATSATSVREAALPPEFRDGVADLAQLRRQSPLPETADELCDVARTLGAGPDDVRLGKRATEHEIKKLSASGELATYRVLHFATHGVLAGQLKGSAEPGLILTPPKDGSEEDDGYLTASEIAGLRLDADWVILSACNTAAGDAPGAEALSGLARSFLYAQARALLVTHWSIASDATVKLISSVIREATSNPLLGRSEALRRAMTAMIDKGSPNESHPEYWAAFILVGEGAGAL